MRRREFIALPSSTASNTVFINARCSLQIEADQRVVVVAGLPVHHYRAEDAVAEAYAMVFLVKGGFARQTDVAQAFNRSVRTIRRYQKRYSHDGMAALGRHKGWCRGRRCISGKRQHCIEMLKSQGMSNRAIAHRLGVSEKAIRNLVGPSKPAKRAHLALAATTTATEKPVTGLAYAKSTGERGDRATQSVAESAARGAPVQGAVEVAISRSKRRAARVFCGSAPKSSDTRQDSARSPLPASIVACGRSGLPFSDVCRRIPERRGHRSVHLIRPLPTKDTHPRSNSAGSLLAS
jgi:transposase